MFQRYLLYAVGLIVIIAFCWHSCAGPKNIISKTNPVSIKELVEIKKQVPDAIKASKFEPPVARPGKKIESTIVVKQDGEIVVINKEKTKIGFKKDLGIWVGGFYNLDGGLSLDVFEIDRFNLGLLAGVRSSGIDLNYLVFRNTSVGIAYTYNYSLVPGPLVFGKINF